MPGLGEWLGPDGGFTFKSTLGSFLASGASSDTPAPVALFGLTTSSSATAECDGAGWVLDSLELGVMLLAFLALSRRVMVEGGIDLGVGGGE